MKRHHAYIGFGSNLGDRLNNCRNAIGALAALPPCTLLKTSSFYETSPVGLVEQPAFINGVVLLETAEDAHWLLRQMLEIENTFGRIRTLKWGPRSIDLDLLFFDTQIINTPELSVPHPLLHERRFVLEPLNEVAPDFCHPCLGKSVADLRNDLIDGDQRVEVLKI
ncbi:MAG: 2-amino-4-hydroxy-6-hydroxymethyldihydropteridine diphosphokinase [Deltaproteobacteria bacterium]|nr:2-amino-4-hydroxy-6-hydroxymethyldihydropteridine diphosphokinase [Deltaproteobacteria bacterium]